MVRVSKGVNKMPEAMNVTDLSEPLNAADLLQLGYVDDPPPGPRRPAPLASLDSFRQARRMTSPYNKE